MSEHQRPPSAGEARAGRAEETGGTGGMRTHGGAERERRVLEARARRLARPLSPPEALAAPEFLTFRVGGTNWAIESRWLVEVARPRGLTPLPRATPPVYGVAHWRGQVLPVYRLAETRDGASLRLLVLGERAPELGLLVDAVGELTALDPSTFRPLAGAEATTETRFGRSITPEAVVVLDAAALLAVHADD